MIKKKKKKKKTWLHNSTFFLVAQPNSPPALVHINQIRARSYLLTQ